MITSNFEPIRALVSEILLIVFEHKIFHLNDNLPLQRAILNQTNGKSDILWPKFGILKDTYCFRMMKLPEGTVGWNMVSN